MRTTLGLLLLAAAAAPDARASERGCTGSVTSYGAGTPGAGGCVPQLSIGGCPSVGGTFTTDITNGPGGAPGDMVLALGRATIPVPLLCATVHVLPPFRAVIVFSLGGAGACNGTGGLPWAVPADPTLAGVTLNFQSGFFDTAACGWISLTNAVELTIGA